MGNRRTLRVGYVVLVEHKYSFYESEIMDMASSGNDEDDAIGKALVKVHGPHWWSGWKWVREYNIAGVPAQRSKT